MSDPPGVKTRPIESFDGCSYLAESGVAKSMSYVLAPLIQNLEELGYEKFHNFFAFTVRDPFVSDASIFSVTSIVSMIGVYRFTSMNRGINCSRA